MQYVKDVVHDGTRTGLPILQFLKAGAPTFIKSDDLAVEHEFAMLQCLHCEGDTAELAAEVLARHRVQQGRATVDNSDGAITVLLHFVRPTVAFGQLRHALALHRFHEAWTKFRPADSALYHASHMDADFNRQGGT